MMIVDTEDELGTCVIKLEKQRLSEDLAKVDWVIDNKKGDEWFSKKAKVSFKSPTRS